MDKLTSEFYVISPVHAVLYCPKTFWVIVMFCCMIHVSRSASVPQWWSVCLTCRCMQVGVPPASAIMRSWYGPCPVPYVLYNKWILKQTKRYLSGLWTPLALICHDGVTQQRPFVVCCFNYKLRSSHFHTRQSYKCLCCKVSMWYETGFHWPMTLRCK